MLASIGFGKQISAMPQRLCCSAWLGILCMMICDWHEASADCPVKTEDSNKRRSPSPSTKGAESRDFANLKSKTPAKYGVAKLNPADITKQVGTPLGEAACTTLMSHRRSDLHQDAVSDWERGGGKRQISQWFSTALTVNHIS